jgi:hypothetical protein
LTTCSAEKLDGLGGSIGAFEGRHAKSNKPTNMKQAVMRIAIEMRRIIVFFLSSVGSGVSIRTRFHSLTNSVIAAVH